MFYATYESTIPLLMEVLKFPPIPCFQALASEMSRSLSRVGLTANSEVPKSAADLNAGFVPLSHPELEEMTGYKMYWEVEERSKWYPAGSAG